MLRCETAGDKKLVRSWSKEMVVSTIKNPRAFTFFNAYDSEPMI